MKGSHYCLLTMVTTAMKITYKDTLNVERVRFCFLMERTILNVNDH